MGGTALASIRHPAVATWRNSLVAELPVWGNDDGALLAGRVDAVAVRDDHVRAVFDWKSDSAPNPTARAKHASQLRKYLEVTGVEQGFIFYMTGGEIITLLRSGKPS